MNVDDADIDARGLACPEPVMKVREALSGGGHAFSILVDDQTARDNVERFARTSGCDVEVIPRGEEFLIRVIAGSSSEQVDSAAARGSNAPLSSVLLIAGDEIGKGESELGHTLMKSFLYSCAESGDRPDRVILMNAGVRLATVNDETVAHLRKLEELGAEIIACGTCLEYYGLKENLRVGRVGNMYEIQAALAIADRLVSL